MEVVERLKFMRSVIFDMDGTLLDTQAICIPAWEYAGNLQGIEKMGDAIYKVCGMNEIGWTKYLTDNYPNLDIVSFKNEMREYIIREGKVVFKKGAKELLDFLKKHNVKMGLASGSSLGTIAHHLKEVGARHYFQAIAGGVEVKNGKPAPDVFLLCANRLGVEPNDCIVFEDSDNGIIAGHKAGMKCIGVPDIVDFKEETKKLMLLQLKSLDEAMKMEIYDE